MPGYLFSIPGNTRSGKSFLTTGTRRISVQRYALKNRKKLNANDDILTRLDGMTVCLDAVHFFFVVLKKSILLTIPTYEKGREAGRRMNPEGA